MSNIEWEMTRMRWRLKIRENIVARLAAENERLRNGASNGYETVCQHVRGTVTQHCSLNFTLTDAEREAIEVAISGMYRPDVHHLTPQAPTPVDTLRSLLERLK